MRRRAVVGQKGSDCLRAILVKALRAVIGAPAALLVLLVRAYQVTLGLHLGGHCRFVPSCSEYAIEAFRTHGAVRGAYLAVRRLLRCQPCSRSGYDSVPPKRTS